MDIDSEDEENQSFSEDEDIELQNQNNEPWQCGLPNLTERVLALYENSKFTDITITFPETEITYDAHRLILAISSPVFESILYGPMRTEGRNVLLHGDDPLIMEYVIAHCYGEDLEPPDMETALEIYKSADKYLLDSLKKDCCKDIVARMSPENNKDVIQFSESFNFTDLKPYCLPLIKEMFIEALESYQKDNECYEDDPDSTNAFDILMGLDDTWFEGLLPHETVRILDFHKSWEYPEIPLEENRLKNILSSQRCYLEKFFGCVKAECIQLFRLENNSMGHTITGTLRLYLSVTDQHHAKRVIEAINLQKGFESNLIALHICCKEVWPRNWSPIRPERTHRPSLLIISDADDDKIPWVVEASKAFLPQSEGSYTQHFIYGDLEINNVLYLPRSQFTPNGFINMLQALSSSGVKCNTIFFESPHISPAHQERIYSSIQTFEHQGFNPRFLQMDRFGYMFRNRAMFRIFSKPL